MAGTSIPDVLREYVIKLGYEEDEGSRRRFVDSITSITGKLATLGLAVGAAAAGVVAGMASIANNLEQLYNLSLTTDSSVQALFVLGKAYESVGATAAQAYGQVQKLHDTIASNPGQAGIYQAITGKSYNPADPVGSERLLEETAAKTDAQHNPALISMYAQLGKTLADLQQYSLMQRRGAFEAGDQAGGFANSMFGPGGLEKRAAEASEFMMKLRKLRNDFDLIMIDIQSEFDKRIGKDLDDLRTNIESHAPQIRTAITAITDCVAWMGTQMSETVKGAIRLWDDLSKAYEEASPQTQAIVNGIGIVLAAFAADKFIRQLSPLQAVALAIVGLLRLFEDYSKWQETGKVGLVDWSKWQKEIDFFKTTLTGVGDAAQYMDTHVIHIQTVLETFLTFLVTKWIVDVVAATAKGVASIAAVTTASAAALTGSAAPGVAGTAATAAAGAMGVAFAAAFWGAVGYQIATKLPPAFRDFGDWMMGYTRNPDGTYVRGPDGKPLISGSDVKRDTTFGGWLNDQKAPSNPGRTIHPPTKPYDWGPLGRIGSWVQQQMGGSEGMIEGGGGSFGTGASGLGGGRSGDSQDIPFGVGMFGLGTSSGPFSNLFGPTGILGGGGASGTGMGAKGLSDPLVKKAMAFMMGLGYSAAQAAGIVANLYHESRLDPGRRNASNHYGIAQWDDHRQELFKKVMGTDIHGSSLEQQLQFVDWELKHSELAAGTALGAATTPGAAAYAFAGYERYENWSGPSVETGNRINDAGSIFSMNGGVPNGPRAMQTGGGLNMNGDVTVNQTNDIHVNGAGDPHATGQAVHTVLRQKHAEALRTASSSLV